MDKQHFSFLTVLVLMLGFGAAGCNFSSDQAPVVITATPNPDLFPTATRPYVTPTPHIVPTPTLPPTEALDDATRALHNGNYVRAVDYFEAVVEQTGADPALRAAAAYGLGEAALREGLFKQAADALTSFIDTFPADSRIPQAHFLRGDAYLGLSAWQAAIQDFNTYLALRPGIIDSYAHERIGDAYLALGQPQKSLEAYAKAADATRALEPLVALRERLAASYLNAGQPLEAVKQYDAILNQARNGPYRASIMLQAAQVLLNNDSASSAYARLQTIIDIYPETAAAYQALNLLLQGGFTVDAWTRAVIRFANEDYTTAIQDLNEHNSQSAVASVEALMMLGRAYREVGNTQAAITTFQTVLDYYTTDPAFGEAWLEQGRTLFVGGDIPGAIEKYTQLATFHPDVPEGAEALWRAGYLYSTQNDVERALATFDVLGKTYPGTSWAQEGLFLGATLAYNNDNFGMATQLFSQLAATGSGELQAAAYLWVGQLYQRDGKEDLARQAYQAAANADPGGYYSLRADDLLNGRAPFTPPADVRFEFDESAALAEAEEWMRSTFSLTQEGALYPLGPLENDPRMIRGRELLAVASYDAAEVEFNALRTEQQDDPLATYRLALAFRDMRLYRLSIEAAARLITLADVETTQVPSLIARLRYPVYYRDLVLPAAQEHNLDPLLVFSLIRQESLFEGFATSFAAAQGLMQIIPDTGEWIALQLNWPDYQNSDVYRPYVNIAFGTFYLRYVLDLVDGVPYAALAGYNGGPGNAVQWLNISGQDLDMFIQTIGFDETRRYVRRIYEQYDIYRELYGTGA